jgi:hypothetical protein
LEITMNDEHGRLMARHDWTTRFGREWRRLSEMSFDPEDGDSMALTLHPLFGHRPAEEAARDYWQACQAPGQWENHPKRQIEDLARQHGLVPEGAVLPEALQSFAAAVGELCAFVGDRYRDPHIGSAGDAIRARYGLVPF